MKSLPPLLATHYAGACTTTTIGIRFTRTDGAVYAFTGASDPQEIDGILHQSADGLDVTSIATSAELAVDNLELTALDDGVLFTHADVRAGRWQRAAFVIFRYNWARPGDGIDQLLSGIVGVVTLKRGAVVAELRDIKQYLQQPLGDVTSKTCRARVCDMPAQAGRNRCGLSAAAWTDALAITALTDARTFTAAASTRGDDWFGEGLITWLTGANAGEVTKVKAYSAAKVFELSVQPQWPIAIGDTFSALVGCRGRLADDCRDKFDNVINFQGEPHLAGIDALLSTPDPHA